MFHFKNAWNLNGFLIVGASKNDGQSYITARQALYDLCSFFFLESSQISKNTVLSTLQNTYLLYWSFPNLLLCRRLVQHKIQEIFDWYMSLSSPHVECFPGLKLSQTFFLSDTGIKQTYVRLWLYGRIILLKRAEKLEELNIWQLQNTSLELQILGFQLNNS